MKTMTRTLIAAAVTGLVSMSAMAADFKLKIQSSDPSGDRNFQIQQSWVDRVEKMSGGRIDIDLLPVGAVVKHTETLSAIKMGILDGHVTATEFFSGQDPAFGDRKSVV